MGICSCSADSIPLMSSQIHFTSRIPSELNLQVQTVNAWLQEREAEVVLALNMWLMASKRSLTCINWVLIVPGCVLTLLHLEAKENSQSRIFSQSSRKCFSVFLQSSMGTRGARLESSANLNPGKLQINPDNFACYWDPVGRCVYDSALLM